MMYKTKILLTFITVIFTTFILATGSLCYLDLYVQDLDARFEYDNNVTRQRLPEDHQSGIIWKLYTGLGVRDIAPTDKLETDARYTLGMRDVNTTNDEDYNSHEFEFKLRGGNIFSFKEDFRIWNSQSDFFHFYDNVIETNIGYRFGKRTSAYLSYKNEQKWFQNKKPEIQARNFYYHQFGIDLHHSISDDFKMLLGYVDQIKFYNRRPIDFKGGKPIVLDGIQRDRQRIIVLGFNASVFNNTSLLFSNQIVRSDSNSKAFDFSGNRTYIVLLSNPFSKLWIDLTYQLVAYNLAAYQTTDLGYEPSETRTDDQSGIKIGLSYDLSEQITLKINYEHIKNTVFFTKDFYESDSASIGMKIKF